MENCNGTRGRVIARHFCVALSLVVASFAPQAGEARYKVVRSFAWSDGQLPQFGELAVGPDGHFYGTTYYSSGNQGFGTVYRVTATGEFTVLHEFVDDFIDGTYPQGGLSAGSDGYLYGVTPTGGRADAGTLYRVNPAGGYQVLHDFHSSLGWHPIGPPIQAGDGNFYGMTAWGGEAACGTVYKLTPATGEVTFLRSLQELEACTPAARLTVGSDGHFYGTALSGGANDRGSVFRFSLNGQWKTLHSFDMDGKAAYAPVMEASNGRFYGTTSSGGPYDMGTVYSVTRSGNFKTVHAFAGNGDGARAFGGLLQTAGGDIYGTTRNGGDFDNGTIFRMSLSGKLRIQHHFGAKADDGVRPYAGLTLADGSLFGTTSLGGITGIGAVYRMTPKAVIKAR